jgi:hypothetical protein
MGDSNQVELPNLAASKGDIPQSAWENEGIYGLNVIKCLDKTQFRRPNWQNQMNQFPARSSFERTLPLTDRLCCDHEKRVDNLVSSVDRAHRK